MERRASRAGFTLIEMALVLVIIGLIVGGILVGRDLVRAAEMRSTLSQLQKLQAAVATFAGKYGCLPGDCANLRSTYGFPKDPNTNNVQISDGNGDGCITSCDGYIVSLGNGVQGSEAGLFWYHLQTARLLDATYNNVWTSYNVYNERYVASPLQGVSWWAGYMGGDGVDPPKPPSYYAHTIGFNSNAFVLAGAPPPCGMFSCGGTIFNESLTPAQASSLDAKIDDGLPLTGSALATSAGNYLQGSPSAGSAPRPCVIASGSNQYSTSTLQSCVLVFKMTSG